MNQPDLNLPVPVLQYPHWRVNLRPEEYDAEAIPSLGECLRIIQHNQVRLRGWSYPHLSNRDNQVIQGSNWIGSWTQFMGHREYWRFYQSKQFIHLFSVREATEQGWAEKLRADTVSHLSYLTDINWDEVPGFISLTNFLYCVTEIVEFAARLCQAGVYRGVVDLNIQLRRIGGFVLTTTWERAWSEFAPPVTIRSGKVGRSKLKPFLRTVPNAPWKLLSGSPSVSDGLILRLRSSARTSMTTWREGRRRPTEG
jgi:hypothetical protein